MRKHLFLVIVVALGLVSCNKNDVFPTQDAERAVVARTPSNNSGYSDYIISEQEAVALVEKDLQNSGGEFAKKQVSDVEPIMIGGIQHIVSKEIFEDDFVKVSDPAFYIVHFSGGGYALMVPDVRYFGAIIVHVQTAGTTSADDFYKLEPSDFKDYPPLDEFFDSTEDYNIVYPGVPPGNGKPIDLMELLEEINKKNEPIVKWWDKHYKDRKLFNDKFVPHYPDFDNSNTTIQKREVDPEPFKQTISEWQTIKNTTVETSLFMTSNFPLNTWVSNYQMGTIAPTLLNFIGFFETPNQLYGQTGNWAAIKSFYGAAPAPLWAWSIDQECENDFGNALTFLQTNCDYCPNPYIKLYTEYSENRQTNGKISEILAAGKPVMMFYQNKAAVAYREELQVQTRSYSGGYLRHPIAGEYYHSKIYYHFGDGSNSQEGEGRYTLNEVLNNKMLYIVY